MIELGYKLSSEEFGPNDLVRLAQRAEQVGFTFALISDHFHPWVDRQGHSPFVWTALGGIAQATQRLRVGTGVTCPTIRIAPPIIAQAAATVAAMMPGRFFLGVGTGENLNEHILGDKWPPIEIRREMLEEAVEVIRLLWEGGEQSFFGTYYVVENARIYTLPQELPPILIAASGKKSASLAGRIGDGLISTAPKAELVEAFDSTAGPGKPHVAELTVCWARTEAEGIKTAFEWWPNGALKGDLFVELPRPTHYEQACATVREEDIAKEIVCGPDPDRHIQAIQKYADAGFDQVCIHQVGPEQEGMLGFYAEQILPRVERGARLRE